MSASRAQCGAFGFSIHFILEAGMKSLKLTVGLTAVLLVGCEGSGAPFAPDQPLGLTPLFNEVAAAQCETISFDDQGFSHGTIVTTISTGFGFDLNVAVLNDPNDINNARIFDTQTQSGPDPDLQVPPVGLCADCAGLNNVLVIEGPPNFDVEGDSDYPNGKIRLTGFLGNGTFFVESYKALDQEIVEGPLRLSVDGTQVGASSAQGDGSVETVVTSPTTFEEVAEFQFGGSGAIDDLVLCRQQNPGRMTGGGVIRLNGYVDGSLVEVKFTHGFTVHCDNLLSNNLEINWGGRQWHIEKESLENIRCTDEPDVAPEPPPAPFDTFEANGFGRLDGVWGSYIWFKLQDAGQPGGKNDKAGLKIWAVGADPTTDDPVVYVPFDFTDNGNLQAHYDQPHGCNVNKPC